MKYIDNKYSIYVLLKDKKGVYVGCTKNVKLRLRIHKQSKDFDDYIILESFDNKKDAYIFERAIIKFITLFGESEYYNRGYILLQVEKELKLTDNGI